MSSAQSGLVNDLLLKVTNQQHCDGGQCQGMKDGPWQRLSSFSTQKEYSVWNTRVHMCAWLCGISEAPSQDITLGFLQILFFSKILQLTGDSLHAVQDT